MIFDLGMVGWVVWLCFVVVFFLEISDERLMFEYICIIMYLYDICIVMMLYLLVCLIGMFTLFHESSNI